MVRGLGLWESGPVLDQGWHGTWHVGVYPRACGSGTSQCLAVLPHSLEPRRALAATWACVKAWACHALAVVCPVGPLQPVCAW